MWEVSQPDLAAAYCIMFGVFLWPCPPFKMCNLNPTETSTCRRCQSDSGRDTLPSGLQHLFLACDPHTYWGGGDLPTPSIPTCPLSSILPSIFSPLCPHVWCAARGHQWHDQPGEKNKPRVGLFSERKIKKKQQKTNEIKQRHEIWIQMLLQICNTFEELVELKARFWFLECDLWQEMSLCRARLSLSASELWD